MKIALAVCAVLASGCADVIGLSDLAFDRAGGGAAGQGGAGGQGGQGAMGGQGGSVPPACDGELLAERFEDDTIDDVWIQSAIGATIAETGGELSLTAETTNARASIVTADGYDIPNGWVSAVFAQSAPPAESMIVGLSVNAGGVVLAAEHVGSMLRFVRTVSLSTVVLWEGAYDETAHRHLRIRATSDERLLEASSDGERWNLLWAQPEGTIPEMLNAFASVGFSLNSAPLEIRFDDVFICGG